MLRSLVSATLKRSASIARHSNHLSSRVAYTTSSSLKTSNTAKITMEQPFEKMAREGEPKRDNPTSAAAPKQEEQELPPLSAKDFRIFNRMAEHMDMFHEHFRQTWNAMYKAAESGSRPAGMSMRAFLNMAEEFCHHLTMHHTIEERHVFPVLAKKQPAFRKELELLTQHKQIHNGLEKFEEYVKQCRSGDADFRMPELKRLMDGFGPVLWEHLDAEVHELRAENMRKFWTAEEMRRLPM